MWSAFSIPGAGLHVEVFERIQHLWVKMLVASQGNSTGPNFGGRKRSSMAPASAQTFSTPATDLPDRCATARRTALSPPALAPARYPARRLVELVQSEETPIMAYPLE